MTSKIILSLVLSMVCSSTVYAASSQRANNERIIPLPIINGDYQQSTEPGPTEPGPCLCRFYCINGDRYEQSFDLCMTEPINTVVVPARTESYFTIVIIYGEEVVVERNRSIPLYEDLNDVGYCGEQGGLYNAYCQYE